MVTLYKPTVEDLFFRRNLLADEATMSYNNAYGGTISFPEENWKSFHCNWVTSPDDMFFYRYLQNEETKEFVGEVAYHYDTDRKIFICEVIISAKHRRKGFGTLGIKLLCEAAKSNGVVELYDDIAIDNPSVALFLKNGFNIEYKTAEIVMVKRTL